MDFLKELHESTEEIETPASFVRWAGLCSISAILRRNVWLDKFAYRVYPNIYVILEADSGKAKGYANIIVSKLVEPVDNTRIISGRNSIQSIIKELSTARSSQNGKPPDLEAACILNSGEFINLIIEDPAAFGILMDLYDSNWHTGKWTNSLKVSGKETLNKPYVVLLGSSNETLLKEALPEYATKGGLIGRTIIVREKRRRINNPLLDAPKKLPDWKVLSDYLKEVSKLRGEFVWSSDAKEYYREWYHSFYGGRESLDDDTADKRDKTGSGNRLKDAVIKVAMCLAVSRRLKLTLELSDIKESLEDLLLIKASEGDLFLVGGAKSDLAQKTRAVLTSITKKLKVARIRILQENFGIINAEELDKVIDNLKQARFVSEVREGKDIFYELTDTAKERMSS